MLVFCAGRWLENTEAAERALLVLPNIIAYCDAAKLKKVTEPSNASFRVVQKAVQDPLITAKLHFFLLISREVQPFLTLYQTDRPMLPFVGRDLGLLLRSLMEKFMKPDVLQQANSLSAFVKLDVKKTDNHVDLSKINVGFVAQKLLTKSSAASDRQKLDFRMGCREFLVAMVYKILERSPVKFPIVRLLSWLDPGQMVQEQQRQNNIKKLSRTLNIMTDAGRVQESQCDAILSQYGQFLDKVMADSSEFASFQSDQESDRLDRLLHSHMAGKKGLADLWGVVKHVMLLSHGQATVERGFSMNKQVSVHNIAEHTIVAHRLITDHVKKIGGLDKMEVSKELILAASSARHKYHQFLEDLKKTEEASTRAEKRRALMDEMSDLKKKKARFEEDIKHLSKSADALAEDAERKGQLVLISESNALRKKVKEKQQGLQQIEKEIQEKIEKVKDAY